MTVKPPPNFTFAGGTGNALRKNKAIHSCQACRKRKSKCDRVWPCGPCKARNEAHLCQEYVRDVAERPTGYTHVSDTSILANRVEQLELALSRMITRLDDPSQYQDLLHGFVGRHPIFVPGGKPSAKSSRTRNRNEDDDLDNGDSDLDQSDSNVPLAETQRAETQEARAPNRNTSHSINQAPMHMPRSSSIAIPSDAMAISTGPIASSHAAPSDRPIFEDIQGSGFGAFDVDIDFTADVATGVPSFPSQEPGSVKDLRELRFASLAQPDSVPDWPNNGQYRLLSTQAQLTQAGPQSLYAIADSRMMLSEPVSKAPSANDEHMATLALEEMALGRGIGDSEMMSDMGGKYLYKLSGDETEYAPTAALSFESIAHRRHKYPAMKKAFPEAKLLPNRLVRRYLIDQYIEHIDYMWKCTHIPTLEADFKALEVTLRDNEFTLADLATLALYATCLCASAHFLDEDGCETVNITRTGAAEMAATAWQVAYAALEASDWMQEYNVRSAQVVIISALYLSGIRRSGQHWSLLGVATKVALALGLSAIPSESASTDSIGRWGDVVQRETGRRVWYCLLEMDWLFAMEHAFTYTITEDLYTTDPPSNVDDSELVLGRSLPEQDLSRYTSYSYSLHRLALIYPLFRLIRQVKAAGRMRYTFIQQAHNEIMEVVGIRAAYFRLDRAVDTMQDANQHHKLLRERGDLQRATDLRLLRIHRHYFPASCSNPRYLLTKQTCLASARRMLRPVWQEQEIVAYWAFAYGKFTATAIFIIYLGHALPDELQDTQSLARDGVEQLRRFAARGGIDFGQTVDVLDKLVNTQIARRGRGRASYDASRKRPREAGDQGEGRPRQPYQTIGQLGQEMSPSQVSDPSRDVGEDLMALLTNADLAAFSEIFNNPFPMDSSFLSVFETPTLDST